MKITIDLDTLGNPDPDSITAWTIRQMILKECLAQGYTYADFHNFHTYVTSKTESFSHNFPLCPSNEMIVITEGNHLIIIEMSDQSYVCPLPRIDGDVLYKQKPNTVQLTADTVVLEDFWFKGNDEEPEEDEDEQGATKRDIEHKDDIIFTDYHEFAINGDEAVDLSEPVIALNETNSKGDIIQTIIITYQEWEEIYRTMKKKTCLQRMGKILRDAEYKRRAQENEV